MEWTIAIGVIGILVTGLGSYWAGKQFWSSEKKNQDDKIRLAIAQTVQKQEKISEIEKEQALIKQELYTLKGRQDATSQDIKDLLKKLEIKTEDLHKLFMQHLNTHLEDRRGGNN